MRNERDELYQIGLQIKGAEALVSMIVRMCNRQQRFALAVQLQTVVELLASAEREIDNELFPDKGDERGTNES
jgi:hypothetical protein